MKQINHKNINRAKEEIIQIVYAYPEFQRIYNLLGKPIATFLKRAPQSLHLFQTLFNFFFCILKNIISIIGIPCEQKSRKVQ